MPLPPLSPSLASIDEEDLRRRLAFLELGEEDQRRLIQLWEVVQGSRDRTIDSFYTHIGAFPEIGSFIEDWQTLQRLHQAQARYARELFTLPCDRAYVQNRLRIGAVHHHLGVEPHWYLASCAKPSRERASARDCRWNNPVSQPFAITRMRSGSAW